MALAVSPPIPDSVPARTVHVVVVGAGGQRLVLESPLLQDAVGHVLVPAARWPVTLDGSGAATTLLPAVDVDTITPVDWSYKVSSWVDGLPDGRLSVPAGSGTYEFADGFVREGSSPASPTLYAPLAGLNAEITARATADTAHAADTTAVHGIADTSALVLTSDARLSDARTPTAHATTHAAAGTDPVTPAAIGAEVAGAAAAAQAVAVQRANHTGTQSADTLTDGTTNKAFLATERTKLSGVATGATANSSDATLLARANHTGTQSADTVVDGSTNKAYTGTEQTKLAGIATGATANATDAALRARTSHTGTQTASTISDFDTQVRTSRLDQMAAPSAAVALGAQKITGLANGSAATDAAAVGQAALRVNNLSDLADASTSRTNLGLGTIATKTATDIREYTSSQSGITTPTGILGAWATLIGGGGGGGSGRRGAAGSIRGGGGGGGGSGIHQNVWIPAALFGATYSVTVGAGGGAGAARSTNDTDGASGGNSTVSSMTTGTFTIQTASGGAAAGGTNVGTGAAGGGFPGGASGGAASATGGVGGTAGGINGSTIATGGGGAGGGVTAADSPSAGGNGVGISYLGLSGGAGGSVGGASPGTGQATGGSFPAAGAGGGAASIVGVAQTGGTATNYGAGGGGGGASLNGNNSGAGGAGGPGYARLIFAFA